MKYDQELTSFCFNSKKAAQILLVWFLVCMFNYPVARFLFGLYDSREIQHILICKIRSTCYDTKWFSVSRFHYVLLYRQLLVWKVFHLRVCCLFSKCIFFQVWVLVFYYYPLLWQLEIDMNGQHLGFKNWTSCVYMLFNLSYTYILQVTNHFSFM